MSNDDNVDLSTKFKNFKFDSKLNDVDRQNYFETSFSDKSNILLWDLNAQKCDDYNGMNKLKEDNLNETKNNLSLDKIKNEDNVAETSFSNRCNQESESREDTINYIKLADEDSKISLKATDKYTYTYRILKTLLLIFAWISFGINNEIVGSTLEDLKILVNLNYERISFGLVLRGFGTLSMMLVSGVLYDKLSAYAELIMAISSFILTFPNFLIPWASDYRLMYLLFLIQGIATATYDLGGNHIVFGLWEGITTSPVNAMHSGYGIGAIIAVQLCKPFIKFDPLQKFRDEEKQNNNDNITYSNQTSQLIRSGDIQVQIPYTIAACIGMLLTVLFVIAQFIEMRNNEKFAKKLGAQLKPLREGEAKKVEDETDKPKQSFVMNLFFGNRVYKGKSLIYMIVQISLLVFAFFCIQGYICVISRFMMTYLTKGPAHFSVDKYSNIYTLYWAIFVVSRFSAAFIAYKLNEIVFVFAILLINMVLCLLFVIPFFTQYELFFWIGLSVMGITSGPMQPSSFMVAKRFLVEYNSFILSIFSVGMSIGVMFFQDTTGRLLDSLTKYDGSYFLGFEHFSSAYVIAHAFFLPSLLCFLTFIPIIILYRKYVHLIRK